MILGVNIDENTADTTTGAHADIAHGISGWYDCQQWTPDGYPLTNNAHCRSSMLGCPAGVYKMFFDGTATIAASWAGSISNVKKTGITTTADLTVNAADAAVMLTATGLTPADPLRNMHIWAPGYGPGTPNAGKLFRDEFTKWLAPFKVVRMIDWAGVNISKAAEVAKPTTTPTTWGSRVTPASWDQTNETTMGVAYEYHLALAKQAGTDWWINIPYLADDDYVRQLGVIIATAPPTMNVLVELANEVWNDGFGQWLQNFNRANTPPNMSVDGDVSTGKLVPYPNGQPGTNSNVRAARLYADRARQISYILRQQLGGHRFKMVLAGQCMWTMWLDEGLKFIQAKYGDMDRAFDVLAVAHYWPINMPAQGTPIATMAQQANAFIVGDLAAALTQHKTLASKYGLGLTCYESGQNYIPWFGDPPFKTNDLPVVMQTDPAIGTLYDASLSSMAASGVDLNMHNSFIRSWVKGGMYALQQTITEAPSVKWTAMQRYASGVVATTKPPAPLNGTVTIGGVAYQVIDGRIYAS